MKLIKIYERYDAVSDHKLLVRFMLSCMKEIKISYPAFSLGWFDLLEQYLLGQDVTEEMESARKECWEHLGFDSDNKDLSKEEVFALRTFTCALTAPDEDDEIDELIRWFIDMIKGAGLNEEIINEKLIQYFDVQ